MTPINPSAAFTEQSRRVFCNWAGKPANTNYDGSTHFCQFCGATDHRRLDSEAATVARPFIVEGCHFESTSQ